MTVQKLLTRGLPVPPEAPPEGADVVKQALSMPIFAPVLLFWDNIVQLKPWWPVLFPLLAWTAWRTYHAERAKVEQGRIRGA